MPAEGGRTTNLALPLGIDLQEPLKAQKLMLQPLDLIQLVPRDHDLDLSVPLPQQRRPLLHLRLGPPLLQRLDVDADAEDLDVNEGGRQLDALGSRFDVLQDPRDGLSEVTGELRHHGDTFQ